MSSQSAFTQPSPLDIPELLQLIASYMGKRDIASCLRVSRVWYQAFLPPLWTRLELNLSKYDRSGPPLPEREKYWSLVQKMVVVFSGNFKMPSSRIKCQNLTHLEIWDSYANQYTPQGLPTNERSLGALIHGHRSSLRVFFSSANTTTRILKALSGCPKLETLKLNSQSFERQDEWMEFYEPLWSRLQSLSWGGVITTGQRPTDMSAYTVALISSVKATIIKELYLDHLERWYSTHLDVLLILKSPELKRLRWKTNSDMEVKLLVKLAKHLPFGKQLRDLRLCYVDLRDKEIQEMLDSFPKLTSLGIEGGVVDMELLGTLQTGTHRFLTAINVLGLEGCKENSGQVVQTILSTMPSLQEFESSYVRDQDIVKSGAQWVCIGLRKLRLAIVLSEEGTQDMILDLLSSLVNLTSLDLHVDSAQLDHENIIPKNGPVENYCLKLTLEHGLDRLKVLRRMVNFVGSGLMTMRPRWTVAEAQWVSKHWVHLKKITGVDATTEARKFLEKSVKYSYY
ncbi:hypothetical protein EMPS_07133 [Entomortierella parvispora]|uniref:F-box domain-containing protein n=1 Tax=Entomortierella parvispora TaxID=205924 RepID=A0A9P3HDK7_9FUNG|nr:hypothetical protein EMPS_07133 [Entomortierella parvispora]